MTIDQFNEASELITRISGVDGKLKSICDLKDRIYDTTGEYQKLIRIQLAEQYHGTPQVEVSLGRFLDFLNGESEALESERKELVEKLRAI